MERKEMKKSLLLIALFWNFAFDALADVCVYLSTLLKYVN